MRTASGLAVAGFGYFVLCGLLPIGNAIILPLENRFANVTAPQPGDRVAGIILLGGFEDGWVSAGRPGLAVNECAERLTEGIRLGRRFPDARIVFTGGVKAWGPGDAGATGSAGRFLTDMGFDKKRLVLEGASRDTHENAVLTAETVKLAAGERWVLVTPALHATRGRSVSQGRLRCLALSGRLSNARSGRYAPPVRAHSGGAAEN